MCVCTSTRNFRRSRLISFVTSSVDGSVLCVVCEGRIEISSGCGFLLGGLCEGVEGSIGVRI